MNYIEQLHLDAIDSEVYIAYRLYEDRVVGTDEAAKKSAEITEQIAIEFAEWLDNNTSEPEFDLDLGAYKLWFQEYLKSKQQNDGIKTN